MSKRPSDTELLLPGAAPLRMQLNRIIRLVDDAIERFEAHSVADPLDSDIAARMCDAIVQSMGGAGVEPISAYIGESRRLAMIAKLRTARAYLQELGTKSDEGSLVRAEYNRALQLVSSAWELAHPRQPNAQYVAYAQALAVLPVHSNQISRIALHGRPQIAAAQAFNATLQRLYNERPDRVQVQLVLTGKQSRLRFVSIRAYDDLIQAIMTPGIGVPVFLVKDVTKAPLVMNEKLALTALATPAIAARWPDCDLVWQLPELHRVLRTLFALYQGREEARAADVELTQFYQRMRLLPEGVALLNVFATHPYLDNEPIVVLRPRAMPGDLIMWGSYHGTGGGSSSRFIGEPSTVMFIDYAPRDLLTRAQLAELSVATRDTPFQFGSGIARHAGTNAAFNAAMRPGQSGGLEGARDAFNPDSDDYERAQYLLGAEDARFDAPLPPVLSVGQERQLRERGWLVVRLSSLCYTEAQSAQLAQLMQRALHEFERYLNWTLFGRYADLLQRELGPMQPLPYLSFSDAPNFAQWRLLGGTKAAVEMYGENAKRIMYAVESNGERAVVAQAGGINLPADSGMGTATNLYDSPAQLAIETHPVVHALMSQVYGGRPVLMVPERFRVKVTDDRIGLREHTDALFPPIVRAL